MSSAKDHYDIARSLGQPKRQAKRYAMVEALRDAERETRGSVTYDRLDVRQAIVHGRQDTVLVIAILDELAATGRSLRRWLVAAVVLLVILILYAIDRAG